MSNLYEIANEYRALLESLDEELTEQDVEQLNALDDSFSNKAIAVASFIKNLEADANAIREAITSMGVRLRSIQNKKENLKEYLKNNLDMLCMNHVSCAYFEIKIKKNPPSIRIDDPSAIPGLYRKTQEIITYDKVQMKQDMDMGIEIAGVALEQKTRLEIK